MSKKPSQSPVSRIARALYRRAPKTFQHKVRQIASESMPHASEKESSQTKADGKKIPKPKSNKIAVSVGDVGTTYYPDVVLPMLALENNVLHQQLRNSQNEASELRRRLRKREAHRGRKDSNVPAGTASTYAEEYLAGQQQNTLRHLVLTNGYPSEGNKASNKSVHKRVKAYLAAGVAVDVVCAEATLGQEIYEFDRVRVLTGRGQEIVDVLKHQAYTSVGVHFLNEPIWSALEPFMPELDVHVFVHGRETSRWIRKLDTYESGKQLEEAIDQSIKTQNFWHKVLNHPYQPKSYIFRSDWWRRAASDDLLVTFPNHRARILQTKHTSHGPERSGEESIRDQELSALGLGD